MGQISKPHFKNNVLGSNLILFQTLSTFQTHLMGFILLFVLLCTSVILNHCLGDNKCCLKTCK